MALTTSLSLGVRNDNKVLVIVDNTNDYGSDNGNIAVSDITSLTLGVSYMNSSKKSVTYDTIDLYALFGPFVIQSDLTFELNPSHFMINSVPIGTADDEFTDGVYHFTYTINVTESIKEYDILFDGRVVNAAYEILRRIPESYICGLCNTKEVLDAIFTMGMIDAMESAAYIGHDESILEQLAVIERLVTNGSNYTW